MIGKVRSPGNETGKYILDEHNNPVEEPDLLKWAEWMESADRHVRDTFRDDVRVSTVFLGLDHNVFEGPPLLFETMVFVNDASQTCERYSTWAEAAQGHENAVAQVFKATLPVDTDDYAWFFYH
jgi:hypothetical protein